MRDQLVGVHTPVGTTNKTVYSASYRLTGKGILWTATLTRDSRTTNVSGSVDAPPHDLSTADVEVAVTREVEMKIDGLGNW